MQPYGGLESHCSLAENCNNTNTQLREPEHTHLLEVMTVLWLNLNVGLKRSQK